MVRTDLDLDCLMTQLRGTFEAKLDQLLALPHDDRACAPLAEALDGINAALARIHAGTYGTCRVCEGLIGAARLEVVPTAVTCVGCNGRNAPA
jgi:RNA polymerase-binding transcription factor DksA